MRINYCLANWVCAKKARNNPPKVQSLKVHFPFVISGVLIIASRTILMVSVKFIASFIIPFIAPFRIVTFSIKALVLYEFVVYNKCMDIHL